MSGGDQANEISSDVSYYIYPAQGILGFCHFLDHKLVI